jgi:rhodanese-related sulfurtransferase
MTPDEVQQHRKAGDKLIVLDARAQVTDAIIPGAVHVPNDEIDAWAKGKPKDALIVTYCT